MTALYSVAHDRLFQLHCLCYPLATDLPERQLFSLAPQLQTPSQIEGPFYPVKKPVDRDNDLIHVKGKNGTAAGIPLRIKGRLMYADYTPAQGTVEIWQCDANGVYNHPRFVGGKVDPYFQYYGEFTTGPKGRFSFLTVEPVHYSERPRHIHVKVKVQKVYVLTTQIYFPSDELLDGDPFFRQAPIEARDQLIITPLKNATASSAEIAEHVIILPLPQEQ
jgi:protocatechuate 3,4-dioxygenase, beta subunit